MNELDKKPYDELLQTVAECLHAAITKQAKDILHQEIAGLENKIDSLYQLEQAFAKNDSLQKKLDEANNSLTIYKRENQDLKTENSTLQTQNTNLQTQNTNLQTQYSTLQDTNTGLQTQYSTLQAQNTNLQTQYSTLQTDLSAAQQQLESLQQKWNAERQQYQGYQKACAERVSDLLPFINTDTYESYVLSIYNTKNILLIFDKMKNEYERGNTQSIEKCNHLVDDYIEIAQKAGSQYTLRRQAARIGQFYESALFDKVSYSNENGKISKVIYQGLEKNGTLVSKSLVEVE